MHVELHNQSVVIDNVVGDRIAAVDIRGVLQTGKGTNHVIRSRKLTTDWRIKTRVQLTAMRLLRIRQEGFSKKENAELYTENPNNEEDQTMEDL